jgi:hypothetical protein
LSSSRLSVWTVDPSFSIGIEPRGNRTFSNRKCFTTQIRVLHLAQAGAENSKGRSRDGFYRGRSAARKSTRLKKNEGAEKLRVLRGCLTGGCCVLGCSKATEMDCRLIWRGMSNTKTSRCKRSPWRAKPAFGPRTGGTQQPRGVVLYACCERPSPENTKM